MAAVGSLLVLATGCGDFFTKSTSGGGLTLGSATTNQASSLATFASGFAGTGWRVDYGVSTAGRASAERLCAPQS